jgi:hypothetical protein
MAKTATLMGDDFENYNAAVNLAKGYLEKNGTAWFQYGSFEDLVENFLSYIEAQCEEPWKS